MVDKVSGALAAYRLGIGDLRHVQVLSTNRYFRTDSAYLNYVDGRSGVLSVVKTIRNGITISLKSNSGRQIHCIKAG